MAETKKKTSAGDLGQAEIQAKFDEAAEKGYFGETPDNTPNENYTLQSADSGAEVPETRPVDERGRRT